jgi:signal transduction histidine kinase
MSSDRTQPLILVVDDDQILRIAAQECLESSGFSVIEAEDGVQAISQFREHSPDLVVLDVMMPIQNGFEVCRALRELPEGQSTPILILTGLCDTASIDQAFAAGATDFAEKPMNWAMFPRRIRYLLRGAQTAEELLRAHRAAETASRAKSEFLRKVTHELRTPMAAILGYVDAMEEEGALAAADGSTAERFERIRENGGSLLSMIESVVEVARVDPSAEPPHALNPADLAREVLDSQRREAEAKALVLGLSSAADLPTRVVVDEHSLRSILHHLVANGIKYTTDGSVQVELSCHRGARWTTLELCVRDTGVGIEAEHREAIFDPFVQLLGPGNAAPTGTGLGLTVVKRLVESRDACISIESEPGSGTAFLVRIPVKLPEGTLDEHETAATTERGGRARAPRGSAVRSRADGRADARHGRLRGDAGAARRRRRNPHSGPHRALQRRRAGALSRFGLHRLPHQAHPAGRADRERRRPRRHEPQAGTLSLGLLERADGRGRAERVASAQRWSDLRAFSANSLAACSSLSMFGSRKGTSTPRWQAGRSRMASSQRRRFSRPSIGTPDHL